MFISQPNLDAVLNAIQDMHVSASDSYLLFIGEHCTIDVEALIEALNKLNLSFFGGIFPSVIFGDEQHTDGLLIKRLNLAHQPFIVHGLEGQDFEIPEFGIGKVSSAFVLLDGLTANISVFLSRLYDKLGNTISYIGGGAGSLTLEQSPCVFSNAGLFQDAAIIALSAQAVNLGVKHGWERISGPFVATSTSKNVIKELNWQNAYEVYRTAVEANAEQVFNGDNFFDIAKGYPFGITKEQTEAVVRDPIAVNEHGELICVGEVPENTVLDILKGQNTTLINAAELAAQSAISSGHQIDDALIFDCISRVLFLENDLDQELHCVQETLRLANENITLKGAFTLGEISSDAIGHLEFYNKTVVVGTLSNGVVR